VLRFANIFWILLGSALTPLLILGLASRWRIFILQQRLRLSFARVVSLTWAGQFFNSILPGSTGGDLIKILQLCRFAPDRKAAAAATVFVDRLTAMVALVTMCVVALLIDPIPFRVLLPHGTTGIKAVFFGLGLTAGGAALAAGSFYALRLTNMGGRIKRTLLAARTNVQCSSGFLIALVTSFSLHLLNFSILYCFFHALHLTITYGQVVLLMMPVVLLIVLLPVTINGHGLRELLLVGYFTHFGVTVAGASGVNVQELAVAASVIAVANDLLWSVPGGILYFRRSGVHGPATGYQPTTASGPRQ
jgi:uncharacterized membrane protein YbhN (UPF0104 family)